MLEARAHLEQFTQGDRGARIARLAPRLDRRRIIEGKAAIGRHDAHEQPRDGLGDRPAQMAALRIEALAIALGDDLAIVQDEQSPRLADLRILIAIEQRIDRRAQIIGRDARIAGERRIGGRCIRILRDDAAGQHQQKDGADGETGKHFDLHGKAL